MFQTYKLFLITEQVCGVFAQTFYDVWGHPFST